MPDVGIKPADLFAPLALLVRHDPRIAKDVLVLLWRAAVATMHSGSDDLTQLRRGVKTLLGSQQGSSVFVACLHELALSGDELGWLVDTEEETVRLAATARKSGNLHTGVRLLENLMLAHEGGGARGGGGGGGKRSRTAGATDARKADPMALCVRLQLVELYHALGEEDIVRGLSAEVARAAELGPLEAALAAQSRGDAGVGLTEFDRTLTLLETSGRGAARERSLALAGRHASLLQLGRWEELKAEMDGKLEAARGGGGWKAPGAESWLHMWLVAHCKTSAAADGTGWGRWPRVEGGPDPQRDTAALLADGLGVYLSLDQLAHDEGGGGGAIGAISALLAPSAKVPPSPFPLPPPLQPLLRDAPRSSEIPPRSCRAPRCRRRLWRSGRRSIRSRPRRGGASCARCRC